MKIRVITFLAATILGLCLVAFAHHGTNASYDSSQTITLKGTVTEFVWSNPHAHIFFDVKDERARSCIGRPKEAARRIGPGKDGRKLH